MFIEMQEDLPAPAFSTAFVRTSLAADGTSGLLDGKGSGAPLDEISGAPFRRVPDDDELWFHRGPMHVLRP